MKPIPEQFDERCDCLDCNWWRAITKHDSWVIAKKHAIINSAIGE